MSTYEEQDVVLNDTEYKNTKLFVFNLKGILLNKKGVIDEGIINEIKNIYDSNNLIAIVSNRGYSELLKELEPIKNYYHFFVANNGAILVDNIKKELLKTSKTISFEFINSILRDVKLIGGAVQIITSKKIYIDSYINFLKSDEWLSEKAKMEYILYFPNHAPVMTVKKSEVIQLTLIVNPNLISALLDYLQKFYSSDYLFRISSNITIDINLDGVNKYEGVKTIGMLYGLKKDNIYCFGDSITDLELMKNIKKSYAKETSDPIIKDLAKNIIYTNGKSSFVHELKKIIKKII
ncbi:MAG: HAD hydrolase family protein [Metamycoplasmataceae bacterium]